jgi:hypothetical protein
MYRRSFAPKIAAVTLSLVFLFAVLAPVFLISSEASAYPVPQSAEEYAAYIADAQHLVDVAEGNLSSRNQEVSAAQSELDSARQNALSAQDAETAALNSRDSAQVAYDTQLVPISTVTYDSGITADVFNRRGYNSGPPIPSVYETPTYSKNVPQIDFNWGSGYILQTGNNWYSEDVIVRFTGNLIFPADGYYQFYTPADDGTKLNIAGTDLINNWWDKGGGGTPSQYTFFRGGVLYPFTLYYYENGGAANVSFQYRQTTTNWQVVPAALFAQNPVTTITYEHDPELLTALNSRQSEYEAAIAAREQADADVATAEQTLNTLTATLADLEQQLLSAQENLAAVPAYIAPVIVPTPEPTLEPIPSVTPEPEPSPTPSQVATPTIEPVPPVVQPVAAPEPEPAPAAPQPVEAPATTTSAEPAPVAPLEITIPEDPQNMTVAEAAVLKADALAVLDNAQPGSEQYDKALEALYAVAQADDIKVDPQLAAVPVLGAALSGVVYLVNFVGNVGADMSPKMREESKKVVVSAVVAGQIAQVAASAAVATTGGASGGTGGSSSSKKSSPSSKRK